jgi:hypothetical protein
MVLPTTTGTGESGYTAEVLDGQRLRVVAVESEGKLRCKIIDDVGFNSFSGEKFHAKDLTVTVRIDRDLPKFRVSYGYHQQESLELSELISSPEWLVGKYDLEKLPEPGKCPWCDRKTTLYWSAELGFPLCADCWRIALHESLTEGVLELLNEIHDGEYGSTFSDADRQRLRRMVDTGELDNKLPTYREMLSALIHDGVVKQVPLANITPATKWMDKADLASRYIVHILAPKAAEQYPEQAETIQEDASPKKPSVLLTGEILTQASKSAPQPEAVRDIVRIARQWIETKQNLDELSTTLATLTVRSKELHTQFIPVVKELQDQKTRLDNVVLALQRREKPAHKDWYESALELLEKVSKSMAERARKYREETTEYSEWLKLEQDRLVQAFSWMTSYTRRVWGWLHRTSRDITELERLVFFSD